MYHVLFVILRCDCGFYMALTLILEFVFYLSRSLAWVNSSILEAVKWFGAWCFLVFFLCVCVKLSQTLFWSLMCIWHVSRDCKVYFYAHYGKYIDKLYLNSCIWRRLIVSKYMLISQPWKLSINTVLTLWFKLHPTSFQGYSIELICTFAPVRRKLSPLPDTGFGQQLQNNQKWPLRLILWSLQLSCSWKVTYLLGLFVMLCNSWIDSGFMMLNK